MASPRPRFGTLTMRSKARSSAACATTRKIGQRVADFQALVEARAADDAVVQAERDEAVFELAHLEGGAHQDRHVVELVAAGAASCSISSPTARASSSESQAAWTLTLSSSGSSRSVNSVLPSRPSLWAMRWRGGAEDVRGRAVVALQPDDGGAGKILLEAQDVVDLGAAPAIDRLVVVADAADVDCCVSLLPSPLEGRSRAPPARPLSFAFAPPSPFPTSPTNCRACGRCASSRSHMYCAVLVSWYSSTRM